MEFTKKQFEEFRKDFEEAVKGVEEKYQISMEAGSISYTNNCFTMKIQAVKNGFDLKKKLFEERCGTYGFTPADYQREFTMNGETYKLTGINSRSKKNPCEITKNDGTVYKCGADLVYAMFEMQKEKSAK